MVNIVSHGSSISIRGLSKDFATKDQTKSVFSQLYLEIIPGECIAICGKSGVGKSTLLKLIAGLIPPNEGEVYIDGKQVRTSEIRIGFVTQEYSKSLFPWLTVSGNMSLALEHSNLTKSNKKSLIDETLSHVGLENVSQLFPWQLSGGMQQRVAIARAIINAPSLLLLDEPFGSLDTFVRSELEDLILKLVRDRGITTILVTHDFSEAVYMSDRVLVMAGHPARLSLELIVDLPWPRAQMSTRSNKKFLELQHKVYQANGN